MEQEIKNSFPRGKFKLLPLIETATAMMNVRDCRMYEAEGSGVVELWKDIRKASYQKVKETLREEAGGQSCRMRELY